MVFSGHMPGNGIAVSYGNFIPTFLHTVLHSGCINVYSHHQRKRVGTLFSTSSTAFIVCRFFLMMAILTSVRWYLIVVLICISLIIRVLSIFSPVYWPSKCLSLEKCLFRSSVHFGVELFVLILSCMRCLYIWGINPLSVASFANIFLPF